MSVFPIREVGRLKRMDYYYANDPNIEKKQKESLKKLSDKTRNFMIPDMPSHRDENYKMLLANRKEKIENAGDDAKRFVEALQSYKMIPSAYVYHTALDAIETSPIIKKDIPLRNKISNIAKQVGRSADLVEKKDIIDDWDLLNEIEVNK